MVLLGFCGRVFAATESSSSPPLAPQAAVEILQTSGNLTEIIAALKVATLSPEARPVAINYLDHMNPSDWFKYWVMIHPEDAGKTNFEHDDAWPPYVGNNLVDYEAFLAENFNLDTFVVFQHYAEGPQGNRLNWGVYGAKIKPGTPMEKLFLDYVQEAMFDIYGVYNQKANRMTGVLNTKTGEFRSWLSPEDTVQLDHAFDSRSPLLMDKGLGILLSINSTAADARIHDIIASDAFWTTGGVVPDFLDHFAGNRYDPRVIAIFHQTLLDPRNAHSFAAPDNLIHGLFLQQYNIDVPAQKILRQVDPAAFGPLLSFITDAQKLDLPDDCQKLLADSKAAIEALRVLHKEAEEDAILPPENAQSALSNLTLTANAPKEPASVSSNTTTSAPKSSSASSSPAPASSHSNLPTPLIALGVGVLLGALAFIFLRKK
jgi:hypothetical protein